MIGSPSEECVSGENVRQTYFHSEQPQEIYDTLQAVFPWAKRRNYISISSPVWHEVVEEEMVTCCLPRGFSRRLLGNHALLTARKFSLTSAESYLRAYYLHKGEDPSYLPEGCDVYFYAENYEEYGRPCPEKATSFVDYYFAGNPDVVEEHFGLEYKRGDYNTLYGVTEINGEVGRVKQYCYHTSEQAKWLNAYEFSISQGL
jgi:hypothetical protein